VYVFDVLIFIIGYTTARVLLPLLSFGKIHVQPFKSKSTGFNALGCRFEENGRIEVESMVAVGIGFLACFIIFLAANFLVTSLKGFAS
jgi:hypothetical protein